MLHEVTMEGLEPHTVYYYKVGILHDATFSEGEMVLDYDEVLQTVVWSDVHSFDSPIPTKNSNSNDQFTFLVYADQGAMGYGNGDGGERTSLWAEREMNKHNIRSVHHIGDLSYANGASHAWDQWLDMVSVFSTRVPLMVAVGNHEYDHTNGGEDGKDPSGVKTPGGFMPRWGDFGTDSNGECGVPMAKK